MISSAPPLVPILSPDSLFKSAVIKSLHSLDTEGLEGNYNGALRMFLKVSSLLDPLNGLTPYNNSYSKIPKDHQSTGDEWPSDKIISGAKYSSVPGNRKEV